MFMATKTITIMDKAYRALLREKNKGESFTEVILKLSNRKGKLMDSFGKWKISEKEMKKTGKELKNAWKNFGRK